MVIYFRVVEDDSKCELLWIERAEDDDVLEQLVDGLDEDDPPAATVHSI